MRSCIKDPDQNPENWREYLERLRSGIKSKEPGILSNISENDKSPKEPLKPHVASRSDGVYWVEPKTDRDTGEIINRESWLCSPLNVIGIGTDGTERFLILRWLAQGASNETTQAIPLADIGEREGWRKLKAGGERDNQDKPPCNAR